MTKSSVTINDIARELNISPSTVSRALNNSSKISENTKIKIRQKASELGYALNLVASSLSKNKTNIIGVVIPGTESYFYSQALKGIEEIARAAGYKILISQTNDSYDREKDALRLLQSTRVDGIIASLALDTREISHFNKLVHNHIPLVLFDRVNFSIPCHKVIVDNYDGAFQATSHLIKIGCKRLAYLSGPTHCALFRDRAKGFEDALKHFGIEPQPRFMLSTDLTYNDVQEVMKLWMSLPQPPDGIFAATSTSGLTATKLATDAGIKVPQDLAIVAFGYQPANDYIVPGLSAVEMSGYEMGKAATAELLNEIAGTPGVLSNIILPVNLVIRNSSFRQA
jgi:LacI family transcriptional regulator